MKESIQQMQIRNGGLNGATVQYKNVELIDGHKHNQTTTKVCGNMVPEKIMVFVRRLRVHLLIVNEIWKEEYNPLFDFEKNSFVEDDLPLVKELMELMDKTSITLIQFYADGFMVQGSIRRFDGEVNLPLSTEQITHESDYEHFMDVISLLQSIAPLAVDYSKGVTVAKEKEVLARIFADKKPETPEEVFNKIEDKKKAEIIDSFIASNGKVTIDLDQLLDPPADKEEVKIAANKF